MVESVDDTALAKVWVWIAWEGRVTRRWMLAPEDPLISYTFSPFYLYYVVQEAIRNRKARNQSGVEERGTRGSVAMGGCILVGKSG